MQSSSDSSRKSRPQRNFFGTSVRIQVRVSAPRPAALFLFQIVTVSEAVLVPQPQVHLPAAASIRPVTCPQPSTAPCDTGRPHTPAPPPVPTRD